MKKFAAIVLIVFAVLAPLPPGTFPDGMADDQPDPEDLVISDEKHGGWEIEELLRTIAEYMDIAIEYDPESPRIAGRKIEFIGAQTVPKERLIEWIRSLLLFQGIVLVEVNEGHWLALDMPVPLETNRPVFVPEDEVGEWKDRKGVFIVSSVTLSRAADADRALGALGNILTPKFGQVHRVAGTTLLVLGDFAPKVAAMVRSARAIEASSSQRSAELRRYERLLAASTTETAARYFLARIEELR